MITMPRRLWLIVLLTITTPLRAGDKDRPAAKLRSPIGTLLERKGQGWHAPMLFDSIPAGTPLLTLPGARSVLEVQEGDVRLILAGNLPELSPVPVLESVVRLKHPGAGHDLEFSLERGRVLIENHMESGPARVRVHIQDKNLDFSLLDKKAVVALELYSRWPTGAPFVKKPKASHQPVGELIFLVVSGKAEIELNKEKHPLQGPGMYRFNTKRGMEGPLPLRKAPEWVHSAQAPSKKVIVLQAAVEKLRRGIADGGVHASLAKSQNAAETALRQLAPYSGTALDDVAVGIAALSDATSQDVRSAGIQALTHYIGRGSAEDVRLYETLVADKVKPGQASIILELLHGLSDEARLRPETYDTLITYLQNDQLAIRVLAADNLYRLVPQGKSIVYDPAAGPESRAAAQAAWRKLIPAGEVPKIGT